MNTVLAGSGDSSCHGDVTTKKRNDNKGYERKNGVKKSP
jgi:hypothetical protein